MINCDTNRCQAPAARPAAPAPCPDECPCDPCDTSCVSDCECPCAAPEPGSGWKFAREAAGAGMGLLLAATAGLTAAVVGGCAGGAQGIVTGADLKEKDAEVAFTAAMAANLAATGAVAAGATGVLSNLALGPAENLAAGAALNLAVGTYEWGRTPAPGKDNVRQTAAKWVGDAMKQLPESVASNPSLPARVARAVVGEAVGMAAGVYAAASGIPAAYASGRDVGYRLADAAASLNHAGEQP
ncbi:MAG: hypothetical protein AB1758_25320 [Candidatus Eremiobacterota bacterium]